MPEQKIFNVSLHRSGTQSFHNLCKDLGLRSQHWPGFDFDSQCEVALSDLNRELVWRLYSSTVEKSDAVCDLPIPFLHAEAALYYPDSTFILIRRNPVGWVNSIRRHTKGRSLDFMEKFQYWSICRERRPHVSEYNDAELLEGYFGHEQAVRSVMRVLRRRFAIFDLENTSIGTEIANFIGVATGAANFGNIDTNRRFYGQE